ncbi:MAG: UDP-N-acetylmuramoyl-L-alanyl-D-glutamate--2,6-diaminopimelate ligase [Bacteroidota bacterium]|jgi:UDP-N-acetylmuramoyl-L-alanyl-D-glutamate--2,6-diaminopimelate ligase
MRQLKEVLYKSGLLEVVGDTSIDINTVTFNSNEVSSGDLFVAVRGTRVDGHSFINQAVQSGAKAVVCESLPERLEEGVTYAKVADTSIALAYIASNYYDDPSSKLKLVGVTGTNGKTTSVTLLYRLFMELGFPCGLISTVENRVNQQVIPSTHTTPDPIRLNRLLSMMVDDGCEYCFMEVSSHAVVQHRVAGIQFAGGVFTNITHDHLDYHKTFDEYIRAKKGFFDMLGSEAFALYNMDDRNGGVMVQNCRAKIRSYGLKGMADFKCRIIENTFGGLMLGIDGQEVLCRLIGSFNAYNITAVYAVAVMLGQDKLSVLTALSNLESVEGRFDYVISSNNVTGIVDYAHTPDALMNVLNTIKDLRTGNETVITVVGCGGDRDKSKRPVMGRIATELSDKVIFTSDNPRSENPETIIEEIRSGVAPSNFRKAVAVSDRKEALRLACSLASSGDIILVAGKGHEKYQEVNGVKYPFDDRQVLVDSFKIFES